ncbi:MAG: histidinol-phosphatase HisJ family protein [Ruminococcaceae bacterium]|nr:histidinol-phosphatase HisJ family protein [Oscillospiraceae bacterium]
MIYSDLHTHTIYCDGKSTVREMVESAIEKGIAHLGFSGHCPMTVDSEYYLDSEKTILYHRDIAEMQDKYSDKIKIFCGIEQDYYSHVPASGFDYIIGSVHYLKRGKFYSVDHNEETFLNSVKEGFSGDVYAFAEEYFSLVGDIVEKTGADIIGHFDLVSKFNEGDRIFDTRHPRYVAAYMRAIEKLIKTKKPFEINTGAISRGYRKTPYPHDDMIREIASRGGKFILTSDSHSKDTLGFEFEKWHKYVKEIGAEIIGSIF